MSLDPARRAGLERSRAIAIARDEFGIDPDASEVDTAPFGVTVRGPNRTVVVVSSDDLAVLGGVLVWVDRHQLTAVALIAEHHPRVHARRVAVLAPEIEVFALDSGSIVPAKAAPISEPHPTPEDVTGLIAMIERSGADVVVEDGIIRAEVEGLEVGRVVTGEDGSRFEVGVGRFDREAGVLLHGDRPTEPTLVEVIERVREHRRPGAPSHAVNRIGRERWLRSTLMTEPERVGVGTPRLVEPVPPRMSLLDSGPAAFLGTTAAGDVVLVVCTVGVDLAVVPEIADLLVVTGADRVQVAVPARDHLRYLDSLLERLPVPTEVNAVEVPWSV